MIIDTKLVTEAVYELCVRANTIYSADLYEKISSLARQSANIKYRLILENTKLAYEKKRPLCQDTGQVIVFVRVPQSVQFCGDDIGEAINYGVQKAYQENYFRKSVVKDALFERVNTMDNTPALIYYEYGGDELEINLLIKGAGAENYSAVKMFRPADSIDDICDYICNLVEAAGEKVCPPVVLGIGVGGTMEYAGVLSKKAFFAQESSCSADLKEKLLKRLQGKVLDIRILSYATHIASLPVAVTINCHCTRHSCCCIKEQKIFYKTDMPEFVPVCTDISAKNLDSTDLNKLQDLKIGDDILLSGVIYTARDAAHARLLNMYESGLKLPIDFENQIIFYAGPCPAAPGEVIGPIGPTTSMRMDKYADFTVNVMKAAAVIGKGECPPNLIKISAKTPLRYLCAVGGVSCVLARCVKSSELVAFDDLGAEAIYKLVVKDLPLSVRL